MKKALVLGGTAAHIALLRELRSRGYYTTLIDYYDNPVAKPYADEYVRESTLDAVKVLEVAENRKVDLVVSACVDQANLVAAYVMERIGKTPPYSYSVANAITDKGDMKRVMAEIGIPSAKYLCVEKGETPDISDFEFPVMVKPADSCGAAGVKKCETLEQFEEYFPFAVERSRRGRAVIEEHIAGTEVSAYCFVSDKEAVLLATAERLSVIDGEKDVIKCYGTIMPSSLSAKALERIEKAATDIARAYRLDNTPLHVQALVDGERVSIIEFAPRVGGGLSCLTVKKRTGFDLISAAVDSWEGKPVKVQLNENDTIQIVHLAYATPGIFSHIEGADRAVAVGAADVLFPYKTKGMDISDITASASRAGAFVVSGANCSELSRKIKKVFEEIAVIDANGTDLTRRDLVLDVEIADYEKRALAEGTIR